MGSYSPNRGQTGDSYALMKDLEKFYNNTRFLCDKQAETDRNLKNNSNTDWYFRVFLGVLGVFLTISTSVYRFREQLKKFGRSRPQVGFQMATMRPPNYTNQTQHPAYSGGVVPY